MLNQIKGWILRDNLFGVDLSKEAVEITRLALWIRTAEEGKSLADLSQNIQQGNSVIPDVGVDPLAFDWQSRFPQAADGRFDCVIGNPPYVKLQNFRKRQPRQPSISSSITARLKRETSTCTSRLSSAASTYFGRAADLALSRRACGCSMSTVRVYANW